MSASNTFDRTYPSHYGSWSRKKDWMTGWFAGWRRVPLPEEIEASSFGQRVIGGENSSFTTYLKAHKGETDRLVRKHKETAIALDKSAVRLARAQEERKIREAAKKRAQTTFLELANTVGRPLHVGPPKALLHLLLAGLLILEIPLNELALEAVFQTAPWLSWAVAILLGGVLLTLAYVLGLLARRSLVGLYPSLSGDYAPKERYTTAISCVILACIIGASISYFLYDLGQIRQEYLDISRAGAMSQSAFFQTGVPKILSGDVHVPLGQDGVLLIGVGAALVFIGAFASFLSHDPVGRYEQAKRDVEKAERACRKPARNVDALQQARVALIADLRDLERELPLRTHEPFERLGARAKFAAMRIAVWRDGYETKTKRPAPDAYRNPDLVAIGNAIATREFIRALFPDVQFESALDRFEEVPHEEANVLSLARAS